MLVIPQQQIRVLHVDDDPSLTGLTEKFLEREDSRFTVETATSAEEGLEIIRDCPPDCVLSDYNMPGMDGLEFLQVVRDEHRDLPFILVTGKGSEAVASDAISAGVTDYLQKQSSAEQYELLKNRIENVVTAQRDKEEATRQQDLMRRVEILGATGGWELCLESEKLRLTKGIKQIYDVEPGRSLSLDEVLELYEPEAQSKIRSVIDDAIEHGYSEVGSLHLQTANGERRIVEGNAELVDTDSEEIVLRGVIQDVTEEKTRERQLRELNRTTQTLQTAETRQEVAEIGVEAARDVLDIETNVIHTSGADDTQLIPAAQTGDVASLVGDTRPVPIEDSVAGRVYRDREPAVVTDFRQDPDGHNSETDSDRQLCLPLAGHGTLIAVSERQTTFDQQDLTFGELLAGTLTAALDRVEREQTARQRQQELELFFEESALGAVQWDDEFRFERLNRRAEEILGYDEAELRGESWETIVAPEDRDKIATAVENLLDADGGTHALNQNVRKDGEVITGEWHNRAVTDANGDVQSIFSKFQDVTARENRKQELEEYETIIEAFADAVYVLDEEGRFTDITGRGEELLATSKDDLLGETLFGMYPETGENDEVWDSLRAVMDTQATESREFHYEQRDEWFEATVYPSESGVSVYLQEVTDRKKREQELQSLKGQYETIAENFPDGAVYLVDKDLTTVRAGGKELSKVGLSPEEVEGTSPHDLFPDELADELCHYFEKALNGTANTFEQEYEGERYRIQTVPAQVNEDRSDHLIAISQNITERAENKQTLEARNERLDEFASIVSHDLRSPLSVVEGSLVLAQETCDSDHLTRAVDALDRSQALIEDLLTLSREGQTVAEVEPVALADVVKSSWDTAETERATLETDVSQAIRADESRVRQLFENLYRNAIKHGSDDVTVSVGSIENGFYVADTGPGIPESDREKIFEAGFSTAENGTGFGLRIVEQVVDAYGWEIAVTESEQRGARFEVTGVERVDH